MAFDLDKCIKDCEDCCNEARKHPDCTDELAACEDLHGKLVAARPTPGKVRAFDPATLLALLAQFLPIFLAFLKKKGPEPTT